MAKGLSNEYVEKLCKQIIVNHRFYGVYPCDIQPKPNKSKVYSLIFNTGDSTSPGEHFIAIYVTPKCFYYFDSFGLKPADNNIKNFIDLNKGNRRLILSRRRVQSNTSNFCGYFCTAFLLSKDRSVHTFNRSFSTNDLQKNDGKVVYFIIKTLENKCIK